MRAVFNKKPSLFELNKLMKETCDTHTLNNPFEDIMQYPIANTNTKWTSINVHIYYGKAGQLTKLLND